MNRFTPMFGLVLLWSIVSLPAAGQVPAGGNKEFADDGLSFSYPAEWALTDQSSTQQQYLALTRRDATLVIAVIASRALINNLHQFTIPAPTIPAPSLRSLTHSFSTTT